MKNLIFASLAVMIVSCSSKGFNKEMLRSELHVGDNRQVTDEEIQKVFNLKPQLPKPFKIGVFFVPGNYQTWEMRWTAEDKDSILQLEEELKKTGEVSKVFLINESVAPGRDLKSLRLAAAHHGADALLVISAAHDTNRYQNAWAATYALLLPVFFVPGTVSEAFYVTRAALWDVRNEYLYMAVEAESYKEETTSPFSEDKTKLLLKAKKESHEDLKAEILRMTSRMGK